LVGGNVSCRVGPTRGRGIRLAADGDRLGSWCLAAPLSHALTDPAASVIPPGTVLAQKPEQLVVECADGPLAILGWQTAQTEA
jgi:hypothetical protein